MTASAIAILVGAGRGERMAAGRPKAFLILAGRPLLLRSALAFDAAASVSAIVAVVPSALVDEARGMLRAVAKLETVVAGGERRQDSVAAGLAALAPGFDGVVLVHDAARPFVSPEVIDAVARAAAEHGAALPVAPVSDTIKRVAGGRVTATLDRTELFGAQTPQGFRRSVLARAYRRCADDGVTVTDEAMAVERLGEPVIALPGSPGNRKLTTPDDLLWAEDRARAGGRAVKGVRVGSGFDAHRLVEGRPLMLGGVRVSHDRGLLGHSDGDCVLHALCDALLGAAALGDMGHHFPSSDERWRGAASLSFLAEVARLVAAAGHEVGNVDVTVIAQSPALAPWIEPMRGSIAGCLGVPLPDVSVKAKSTDALGALGRSEGIAALATVLLRARPRARGATRRLHP